MIQAIGAGAQSVTDPNANSPVSGQAPATTQPGSTGPSGAGTATPVAQAATAEHDNQSSTKVVVERGENQLVTVFKVLDRATGAVLTEVPHQAAQAVAADPNYTAGSLFNSKA